MMAAMDAVGPALRIVDGPENGRYEAFVGDRLAGLVAYRLRAGQVVFLHTEVLPAFEGRGSAAGWRPASWTTPVPAGWR